MPVYREGDLAGGRYRIAEPLGSGGEGSVFLALDIRTEQFWALKVLNPRKGLEECGDGDDLISVRSNELNAMKSLNHRALPKVIDVFADRGCVVLVMEHIRGVSLDRVLKASCALTEEQTEDIAMQAADALIYLHGRTPPVFHLDIKPANLIRRPDGQIALVDFGASLKQSLESKDVPRQVTDGYAAPEMYDRNSEPDGRTDIYELGATMYRMISGKHYSEILRGGRIPGCGEELEGVILRCLEKDPSQRYQTAEDFRDALSAICRKKRRRQLRKQLLSALALACPAAAVLVTVLDSQFYFPAEEQWDYEKYLREAKCVSGEQAEDYYRRAALLEPARPEGYLAFLESAGADGDFSGDEELFFRDLMHTIPLGEENTNEEIVAAAQPLDYGFLCFRAGLMYWYDYDGSDGKQIASGWLQKAVASGESARASSRDTASVRGAQYPSRDQTSDGDRSPAAGTSDNTDAAKEDISWLPVAELYAHMSQYYGRLLAGKEQIASMEGESAESTVRMYWEDLGNLLESDLSMLSGVTRMHFYENAAGQLAFLAGDLAQEGITGDEIGAVLDRIRAAAEFLPEQSPEEKDALEENLDAAYEAAENLKKVGRSGEN